MNTTSKHPSHILFITFLSLLLQISSSSISKSTSLRSLKKVNSGVLSLDFIVASENQYLISKVELGTPPQQFNLVLDISSERTWVSQDIFKCKDSTSYSTKQKPFPEEKEQDNFVYKGLRSTETITLANKTLENFDFLLVDQTENLKEYQGVISLGREYDSKKFSLVYKMSASLKTFFNTFVLRFKDSNSGELYIGDITEEMRDHSSNIHSCTLIRADPKIKWACQLTHMFIGEFGNNINTDPYKHETHYVISKNNQINYIDRPASFETIYNKIYVNKDVINYLKKKYFVDGKNKLCNLKDEGNKMYFTCSQDEITKLKKLNFVFSNKLGLSFNYTKLFECIGSNCQFLVMYDRDHDNGFKMGLPILKSFDILFDYNQNELSFYSVENKGYVNMPEKSGKAYSVFKTFSIIVILLVLAIIGFIFFRKKKNQKRKEIEKQIFEKF